jgi:hypothetical protein
MRKRTKIGAGVVLAAALAGGSAAWATAGGGADEPLTGSTLARASAAALWHTGGGAVTEAEVGDGGAAYEVEVRLADGRQVEIDLGADFRVLGEATGDDGSGDQDESGGDD